MKDLYLKCYALLLVDVFEKFRNSSIKTYGLCLNHYLSAPALNWDAILNMAKVELEIIADADIYLLLIILNSLKEYASEVDLEYSKLVRELDNDYSSAPDEIEINEEILSNCQSDNFIIFPLEILKIVDA